MFLTKDKKPPIEIVDKFLEHHGLNQGMQWVRTDQDGELAKSSEFRKILNKHNYILETTGSDASFQNAMAERPHRIYGEMMRTMLMASGLPNTYWSYAILHSVCIKN